MALVLLILAVTAAAVAADDGCDACKKYFDEEDNGKGTAEKPYEITKFEDLTFLRDCVNSADVSEKQVNDHKDLHFKLTQNISLNTYNNWTPIGKYLNSASGATNNLPFSGTFDGDGKTISNLRVTGSEITTVESLGLFGYVGSGGTVKNLKVRGSVIGYAQNTNAYHGGVVGLSEGKVISCSFGAGNEKDSHPFSSVTGRNNVGGVVGYNRGVSADVSESHNTGSVNALGDNTGSGGSNRVGGVVGWNALGGNVTKCYNTGSVTGTFNNTGGVVGVNAGTGGDGTPVSYVSECYNTGHVSGPQAVGGVVGANFIRSYVENCYNTGNVTFLGDRRDGVNPSRGGVAGFNAGTVENSYSYCEIAGVYNVGGVVGWNNFATTGSGDPGAVVSGCVSLTWKVESEGTGAAASPPPVSVDLNVGRIVGRNKTEYNSGTQYDGKLFNNKAREDMELHIRGANHTGNMKEEDTGLSGRHGKDVNTYYSPGAPSSQRTDVFNLWDIGNEEGSSSIWIIRDETLTQNARLPILRSLHVEGFRTQVPRLPAHPDGPPGPPNPPGPPKPPGPGNNFCEGGGCDVSGFAAPGLLTLAAVIGMKRFRRRKTRGAAPFMTQKK